MDVSKLTEIDEDDIFELVENKKDRTVLTRVRDQLYELFPTPDVKMAIHDVFFYLYTYDIKDTITFKQLKSLMDLNDECLWEPIVNIEYKVPSKEYVTGMLRVKIMKFDFTYMAKQKKYMEEQASPVSDGPNKSKKRRL
jgi:hypothetical protein